MAWKDFEYSYIHTRNDLGYRPYVMVDVEINKKHIILFAIIDSGAHDTVINIGLAESFGLNVKKLKQHTIGGVGGTLNPGYATTGTLCFPDMDHICIESPLIFTEFPADMLLGQNNFFRNFNILFEGRAGKFRLNKVRNYKDER